MAARHVSTPLQRQLAGTATARPTALDAFRLARRSFLAGDRVDMQALARALNVDRATLYRWVGSREQLLSEILWSLIDPTIEKLRKAHCQPAAPGQSAAAPGQSAAAPGQSAAAPGQSAAAPGQSAAAPGQSAAAAVITGTVRAVIANPGMQRFLDREGDLALRLLTTKASGFEARLIALIADLVSEETSAGRLTGAIPLDDLPYVLVRIMESYIYLGLITGEHPDPDRAARVINALLPC
jgi:AcrR family transcriptional regulator